MGRVCIYKTRAGVDRLFKKCFDAQLYPITALAERQKTRLESFHIRGPATSLYEHQLSIMQLSTFHECPSIPGPKLCTKGEVKKTQSLT